MQIIKNLPQQFGKIMIFIVFSLFLSANLNAQEQKISLSKKQMTIRSAFEEIEKQTSLTIAYNDAVINVNLNISEGVTDKTLTEALNSILKETNATFKLQGKQILIIEKTPDTKKQYSGTVVDDKGDPVIGASVIVKGIPATGTITDFDGNFAIDTEAGSVLIVSYIGFLSEEKKVGNHPDKLKFVLKEDSKVLDEVVVTALGIKRSEKALSYNVQALNQDDLVKVKDANFVKSLNGKVAGVSISKSATGIGGAARVVIRGAKSIEGDNNVLYVIDGIPLFNTNMGNTDSGILGEGRAGTEGIADFNPEDIESLSILSGPSAAALYGSSAANGAILITTKKGKEGKVQISFSSSVEFSQPLMLPKFQNTYRNKKDSYESWGNKLSAENTYNPKDDFFNTGINYINAVTLTTGNKYNQTFVSVASTNADGIVPNNSYDRLNLTIRNSSSLFNDKVKLDLGAAYVKQKDMNMVSQGLYWNPIVAAYLFPRGESFEAIKTFEMYNETRKFPTQYWPVSEGTFASQNPYWTAYRNTASSKKNRFMFNAGLTYEILSWLNITGRYRLDHSYIDFERKIYASSDGKFAEWKGNYEYSDYKDVQEYADFMLNMNKYIGDFSIAANLGFSYSNFRPLERGYKGNLLGATNLFAINNIDPTDSSVIEKGGDKRVRNLAVFANVELGWKSMLYMTLTGRNDWNSRLVNTSEESFFYPSIGLSAIVSEMVKLPDFISHMKLRGSFTEVGAPISVSGLSRGTVTVPIIGGIMKEKKLYPFEDFKAERTRSYEFGLNLRLLKNRITLDATYYKSNTYNQTFLGDLPESSGYEKVYLQAGDVENKGWEVALGYHEKMGNFAASSTLIFTKNTNVIKKMVENFKHPINPEPINISEVQKEGGRIILKEGGSINDIYASKFLRKDNQGYVDMKEDGSYGLDNKATPVYLGKTTPDFTLGWNNTFRYKNVGLSFLLNGRFGGVVTSSTQAILDRFGVSEASGIARDNGGVMIPNQGKVDAETYYKIIGTGETGTAGYYTYSATNVRLQELTFSYSFPSSWFKHVISDLTLSFIANNPWMIYCKAPHDPELTPSTSTYGQGNDYFMQPSVKSFGFGVKVKF